MNTKQIQKVIENEPTLEIREFSESVKITGKKYIFWNGLRIAEISKEKIKTMEESNGQNYMIYDRLGISHEKSNDVC